MKLEEISAAYVEIIEDFQQKALQQGSEDPASAEMLQKCEELLPGQVKKDYIAKYSCRAANVFCSCTAPTQTSFYITILNHVKVFANQSQQENDCGKFLGES